MDDSDAPAGSPPVEAFESTFRVRSVRTDGDRILYFGEPLVPQETLMERVWPAFREAGYEVRFTLADRVDVDPAGSPGPREDETDADDPGADGTTPGDPAADAGSGTGSGPAGRSSDPAGAGRPGRSHRAGDGRADRDGSVVGATGLVGGSAGRRQSIGDRYVLVAEPVSVGLDGVPWTNVVLFAATVLSTLYAGSLWYHIDVAANPLNALQAWPFTLAIMGVLGVHELGHYAMSRYHGVNATLPYFIPVPTLIGTMGAVIRMKGRMPDREALFDIGVAGPLAGLVATVVVTAVGLYLPPVAVPEAVQNSSQAVEVRLGFPPLMYAIAAVVGRPLTYGAGQSVNPVVIGGWVGMFVTFLNMLPVGQLDGGHVLRAMLGEDQRWIAGAVPVALFGLAGYLAVVADVPDNAVFVWVVWGLFASLFAFVGPASPIDDEPLDRRRIAVGLVAIVGGALCFAPVPIAISG